MRKTILFTILFSLTLNVLLAQETWVQNDGVTDGVWAIAVDPNGEKTLAGTSGSGVYLSTDGGSNWTAMNNGLSGDALYVRAILFSEDTILIGTGDGVYKSIDNGSNWTAFNNGLSGSELIVYSMSYEQDTLYIGTGDGIFLSIDNGANWTGIGLEGIEINSLVNSGGNIIAGTNVGIYLSSDNGNNWNFRDIGQVNLLKVSENGIYAACGYGLFLSIDNGDSWTDLGYSEPLTCVETDEQNILVGGVIGSMEQYGISYAIVDNYNWEDLNTGIPDDISIWSIAIAENKVLAGTDDGIYSMPYSTLSVSTNSLTIESAIYSTATFDIAANSSWSISYDEYNGWFALSSDEGSGNTTVTVTVNVNESVQSRSEGLTVYTEGFPYSDFGVTITQEGATPELSVSTNSMTINASENSTASFQITSNTDWNVSSSESWLTANRPFGSGNEDISLSAEANLSSTPRNATVTVSANGVSDQEITVTQDGLELTVSTNALTIGAEENSTASIDVISNTSWTVSSSEAWLTVSPNIGSGTQSISLSAEANISSTPRTTIVTVSGTGVSGQEITVTQDGLELTVSTNALTIGAEENSTASIDVISNTSWTVSSSEAWLTADIITIGENTSIGLTAEANLSATPRTATVTVSGTGVSDQEITVTQEGAAPALILSPNSIIIEATENSTATFEVLSNTSWSVSSSETWLAVSPNSGSDTATVTLTVEANTATGTRAVVVTVTVTGVPDQTVMVVQNGVSVGINKPNSNSINIYPNPASEMLHIEGLQRETTGRIYNANGQMIFSDEIGVENGEINVSELPSGLYILKMDVDEGVVVKRFMKK